MDCIQIERVSFAARSTRRRQHLSRYIRTAFTVLAVEHMEGVSFKDAFLLLGGDYPDKSKESNFARRMKQYHFEKQREMRQKEQAALDVKKQENGKKIDLYRDALKMAEPLSDAWCEAYNNYQLQLYEQCCLYGLETRW